MKRVPLKSSRGTTWPALEAGVIALRDGGCVGPRVGFPGDCYGQAERHHVRASHGMGMKSESTRYNGVLLCNGAHHPWATVHGREARPLLIAYLQRQYPERAE